MVMIFVLTLITISLDFRMRLEVPTLFYMSLCDNPFQSPQVSPADETVEKQPARPTAPASITVFGVLNLVFGALGVCGLVFAVLGLDTMPLWGQEPL